MLSREFLIKSADVPGVKNLQQILRQLLWLPFLTTTAVSFAAKLFAGILLLLLVMFCVGLTQATSLQTQSEFSPLTAQDKDRLAKYQIIVLLDESRSMDTFDCYLRGDRHSVITSRWDWACRQLDDLALQTSSFPSAVLMQTFNSDTEKGWVRNNQIPVAPKNMVRKSTDDFNRSFNSMDAVRSSNSLPLVVVVLSDSINLNGATLTALNERKARLITVRVGAKSKTRSTNLAKFIAKSIEAQNAAE